jgi:hypothetical protein
MLGIYVYLYIDIYTYTYIHVKGISEIASTEEKRVSVGEAEGLTMAKKALLRSKGILVSMIERVMIMHYIFKSFISFSHAIYK